jgi:lipoprotein-releasing system ATP-binding protein
VAIARALVSQPKIIRADEPTGNLDPKTADHVFNVLKEQTLRLKAILIMATHNMELARFLDRKATLVAGKLQ